MPQKLTPPNLLTQVCTKNPASLPDFSGSITESRAIYGEIKHNFQCADVAYPEHVQHFSGFIFAKLHPAIFPEWVEFLCQLVSELALQDAKGHAPEHARLKFLLAHIPDAHKHLISKDNLSRWLQHPDKEIRLLAATAFKAPPISVQPSI